MDKRKRMDAVDLIRKKLGDYPGFEKGVQEAHIHLEIAQMIYDARTAAELTQKELADRVGTTQSVISRLENADYAGHSVTMLQRIAAGLNQRVELRFVPVKKEKPSSLQFRV